jgi:hypothetical protein
MRNHNIPFDSNGEVRLAVKQGKPEKPRKDLDRQLELINICLNCEKKECRGCMHDKRFKKQRMLTDKELLP